ncbi:response regulator [Paenibacillus sp. FSL R5-0636]|uniref:response regulator transcription factor n=1 Tax=Paenibacillus TaxID=44249 RepID=UPI00096C6BF6|nr:response regulator [Paenibacillus odorifer]OMC99616.1 hypothetical protein BJP46_21950 [Paenibacillus odorifer]OMD02481.1 hypothetical protein BJP49_26060 [Paenibacillus odorifer]
MYKVMVVDDEPLFRYYMRTKLDWSKYDFSVCGEASNGREALEEAERTKPDLALVDISMPYMDGMELVTRLQANAPDMLIVFVTGHNEFDYAQKAIRLGVQDYLLKPFNQQEFNEMMIKVKQRLQSHKIGARKAGKPEIIAEGTASNKLFPLQMDEENSSEGIEEFSFPSKEITHLGIQDAMLMALKMGDGDAAAKDISKLIEILRRQRGGGSYSFTLLMSIVSLCLAYAGERGINPESLWKPAGSPEQRLREMDNWDETESWIKGLYSKVIDQGREHRPSKSYNLFIAAKEYIREHYSDCELTVDQVANGVYVDTSYLRKVFRKEGGISVLDFITYTRMKQAKELLAGGNVRLSEIAGKVGYNDPNYFSKCFKKHYGMPPSEFEQLAARSRHIGVNNEI